MSSIILFTGGARSGKSLRAEQYAGRLSRHVTYIATAEAHDGEMRRRIARHRERRPVSWSTLEAPLEVAAALRGLAPGSVALLDCVALLVSNLLLASEHAPEPAVDHSITAMLSAVRERDLTLVAVTNEVGLGVVPPYALGRIYRDLLGRANQQIAAAADEVHLLICGIAVEIRSLEAAWLHR